MRSHYSIFFKGESKVFLFIGFLLAVYSKLPLLTLGIIALLVAVVYVQVTSAVQPATAGADYDDEDVRRTIKMENNKKKSFNPRGRPDQSLADLGDISTDMLQL